MDGGVWVCAAQSFRLGPASQSRYQEANQTETASSSTLYRIIPSILSPRLSTSISNFMMFSTRFVAIVATMLLPSVMALPASWSSIPFVPGQFHYSPPNGAPPAHFDAQHARKPIKGSYMVVLKDGVSAIDFFAHRQLVTAAQSQASAYQAASTDAFGLNHIYDLDSHFQGYSGKFTDDVLAWIRAQPEVEFVEQDTVVSTTEMPSDGSQVREIPYDTPMPVPMRHNEYNIQSGVTQSGAPWGLARISHRKELGFGTFNKYLFDEDGGEGVTAYVIDTGININHVEFEGRARWGKTMPQNDVDQDDNGHGTHCAGTIASRKYGVAKKADLVAVKVLGSGGSGSMSDVTGGVLWAVEDAKEISSKLAANPSSQAAQKHKGFVANMSLGGGRSPALDKAVNGAVSSGLHFAVAAGNENQDACNVSPAGATNPVTVGASTIQDERAYFSNKGKCVDIFGPGLNILSTWNTGNKSENNLSGTSMASPHVVGLLAYLLSIYGSDSFRKMEDAIPMPVLGQAAVPSLSNTAESLADKIVSIMPLPAIALNALHSVVEFVAPSVDKTVELANARVFGSDIISVLHPSDMKKALIKLSTPGVLSDIDSDTINKLAFNNATSLS